MMKKDKIEKSKGRVSFYTLGCKVNQYETDLMMKKFQENGYDIVDFTESADISVINSCSVTNLSTRKTRQMLSKAKKSDSFVVLAGCYAQEIHDTLQINSLQNVDFILGNEEKNDIVAIVEKAILDEKQRNDIQTNVKSANYQISDIGKVKKYVQRDCLQKGINVRESVKIEDGCNNFCSYCIIPYVRGRVRSRNLNDIVREVQNLVDSGVGEVVLVGIEIASYGQDLEDSVTLMDVIEKINDVEGLKRIRLGSIEPRFLTDDVIERLAKVEKLCPHFHISVQSLSNSVLKRMNRKYTREHVLQVTKKIKEKIPVVKFTCDIIVGFPGETKSEFEDTIEGVKEVDFYEVHAFKYSKRKWTRAAKMENQVDGNVANKRSETLIQLGNQQKMKHLKESLGKTVDVLIESYKDGYLFGYTANYMKVKIKGDKKLWGCLLKVELDSIEDEWILGNICL